MTLNGPRSLIDSKREAVASGDAVEGDTEEYRPPIDELLSSTREDIARLAQILRQLHCSAVLRGMDGAPRTHAELWAPIHGAGGESVHPDRNRCESPRGLAYPTVDRRRIAGVWRAQL